MVKARNTHWGNVNDDATFEGVGRHNNQLFKDDVGSHEKAESMLLLKFPQI